VQLKPQLATAHYNLAHAHAEKGVIDDAIRCYQEAIRLKPELIEAHIS
jgi:tetratricopeptide (TPR) repeat protein